jgi:ketosteroid isomerase-like protein
LAANAERVRAMLAAYNRGEWQDAFAAVADDVEWVVAREHPSTRTVHGPAELRAYHEDWQATLPGLTIDVTELEEHGDAVLSVCRLRGTGAGSGAEVGVEIAFISRFRDGKLMRVEEFLDPAEARAALS